MSNILITGGAGFIGSHTADALLAEGHTVRVLDILDPQIHGDTEAFPAYLNPGVECVRGDVRNPEDVARALQGIDVVFHFAAMTGVGQSMYDIRDYVDINVTGTATLIETIVKSDIDLKAFVLSSSRAVYGEGTHRCPEHGIIYPQPRQHRDLEAGRFDCYCPECGAVLSPVPTSENRPLLPLSVYARTKLQQEELCQYAAQTYGLPVRALRYFNVYGSRQSLKNPYTGVVSIFFSRIRAGKPVFLYENGKPGRDFVHVSDVVRANLLAMQGKIPAGTCINVGTGNEHTIQQIALALGSACGIAPDLQDRGEFRVGDIHSCYADLDKAGSLLDYSPGVGLEEGMREFATWAGEQESVDLYQQTVEELQRYNLFGRAGKTTA
jgi:dTDP-L-rhamnose 4-epimerase